MDNFFQDISGRLKKASTVAGPRLQEVTRSLTEGVKEVKDGVSNLMTREPEGLYEEDEALGHMISSLEAVRQTLKNVDIDVKQYRKDLIAVSKIQYRFGEHVSLGGNRIQSIFDKYLSEERIVAHLSFSASEVSCSTVVDRYANEFGFPIERLAAAFEEKYSDQIATLRRRYVTEKTEYLKHKRAADSAPSEARKYDELALAESLMPKWKATSAELMDVCERILERTVKRLSDILINLALFRQETVKNLVSAGEHSAQTAEAFRDEPAVPTAQTSAEKPSEAASENVE